MTQSRIYLREGDQANAVFQGGVLVKFETPFLVPTTGTYMIAYDLERPERTTLQGPIIEAIGGQK